MSQEERKKLNTAGTARGDPEAPSKVEELNSIRPARIRRRSRTEARALDAAPLGTNPGEQRLLPRPPTAAMKGEQDHSTVPQAVRDGFTQAGGQFYFRDGRLAFQDDGRKLSAASEDPEIIAVLIQIAHARGWQEVALEGTKRFCREAWRHGRIAGLGVRGYKASAAEYVALRRDSADKAKPDYAPGPSAPGSSRPEVEASVQGQAAAPLSPAPSSMDELITGELVAHGRAAYRFNLREEPSYFVRIGTGYGQRTIWGSDLERAIEQSFTKPKVGDAIALRRLRSDSVTVKPPEHATEGSVPKEQEPATRRYHWVLEKRDFFEARAKAAETLRDAAIEPREGVRRHPELVGSYLNLRAAELAAGRFRHPEDRVKFIEALRSELAESIARGEPWPHARLRKRPEGHADPERGHPPRAAEVMTR